MRSSKYERKRTQFTVGVDLERNVLTVQRKRNTLRNTKTISHVASYKMADTEVKKAIDSLTSEELSEKANLSEDDATNRSAQQW